MNYYLPNGDKRPLEHRVYRSYGGGIATAVTVSFHPWFALVNETK